MEWKLVHFRPTQNLGVRKTKYLALATVFFKCTSCIEQSASMSQRHSNTKTHNVEECLLVSASRYLLSGANSSRAFNDDNTLSLNMRSAFQFWVILTNTCTDIKSSHFEYYKESYRCRTTYDHGPIWWFGGGTGECAYMLNWCGRRCLHLYDKLSHARVFAVL